MKELKSFWETADIHLYNIIILKDMSVLSSGRVSMRVGQNITIYAGAQPGDNAQRKDNAVRDGAAGTAAEDAARRKTVFAGDLMSRQGGTLQDRIAEKKAKAQEKAMKVVSDAFHGELKIDECIEESLQHIKELQEEHVELQDGMANIDGRQETLDAARENGEISEEAYQEELEALNQERGAQMSKLAQNEGQIMGENASVRGTRLERLKHRPMEKAWEQADAIMDAAGDEAISMAVQGGVDHMDEEMEKREEQAEKIEEEKEEKEKLLEKQKEREEKAETLLEDLSPREFSDLTKSSDEVQKEVQDMLRKMNLLDEDIKGAAVDESL